VRKIKLLAAGLSAGLLVLFFQNCAKAPMIESAGNSTLLTPGSGLAVSARLETGADDLSHTPLPEQPEIQVRFEKPLGVEFKNYRLAFETGQVFDLHQMRVVYELNDQEKSDLKAVFDGSVVLPQGYFLAPDMVCKALYVAGYAMLITEQNSYEVGSGACSPLDLYKAKTKEAAGLKQYLSHLELLMIETSPTISSL
jgi:hypothetical protein